MQLAVRGNRSHARRRAAVPPVDGRALSILPLNTRSGNTARVRSVAYGTRIEHQLPINEPCRRCFTRPAGRWPRPSASRSSHLRRPGFGKRSASSRSESPSARKQRHLEAACGPLGGGDRGKRGSRKRASAFCARLAERARGSRLPMQPRSRRLGRVTNVAQLLNHEIRAVESSH